jgi:hypothetical protein
MKCTKNKFCIKLVFVCRDISRGRSIKHKKRIYSVSLHPWYLIQERRILSNNCHSSYMHMLLMKYTHALVLAKWHPDSIRKEHVLDVRHILIAFKCSLRLHFTFVVTHYNWNIDNWNYGELCRHLQVTRVKLLPWRRQQFGTYVQNYMTSHDRGKICSESLRLKVLMFKCLLYTKIKWKR